MSTARGSNSVVLFKPESTYGTFPSGNFTELLFVSESFGGNINEIVSQEIQSDRSTPAVRGGNITTGGNLVTDFSLARLGPLISHLCGEAPTTSTITPSAVANTTAYVPGDVVISGANDYLCIVGGTTGGSAAADLTSTTLNEQLTSGTAKFVFFATTATTKYRHIFNPADDFLDNGLAFEKQVIGGDDDVFMQFVGARINSLQLQIPQEGIVQATWDMLFSGLMTLANSTGGGTPVSVAEDAVVGYDTSLLINGTLATAIREANLTISNNVDGEIFVLGSRFRNDIVPRRREVTGTVTAYFQTKTDLERFLNETEFSLKFCFARNNGFGSVEFEECKFFGNPVPQTSNSGAIMQTFNFRAFKQGGSRDFQIVLKNLTAAYTV